MIISDMADAKDLYRSLEPMTEYEVAAEVVARLMQHKMMEFSAPVVAKAAAVLGIPVSLIRDAWMRRDDIGRGITEARIVEAAKLIPLRPGKNPFGK